ncbi:MAG TPA: mercuric reductase [Nitrospiraceae bacterium]|nr:mercuric reductase [Nitrospiraceae bacterium]
MTGTGTGPVLMPPDDEYNRKLVENVHPPAWVNPEPTVRYNLVVIGAGTAGLVTAAVAAGIGAKVALIEKHLMGGDCLNVGCVPSKALIRASRAWADVRMSVSFGVHLPDGVKYDFGAAMARMRQLRARISQMDSARRFTGLGVDVFIGEGRFTGSETVEVTGDAGRRSLRFAKAAICTGARAAVPPIPGLEQAGCLTNETVFTLTDLPPRLAVIGAGPIGCEMAQSFARFGSRVVLIEQAGRILPREDAEAAAVVQARMQRDGVTVAINAKITQVELRGREKVLRYDLNGTTKELAVEEILIGVGRAPNVEGLALERVGVEYDRWQGVTVNDRLQTSNPCIYAAGDICFPFKFTHTADALAQIVIQNALFPHPLGLGYASTKSLIIPWCTYTQPELAHVGLYESEARARGLDVETYTYRLEEVDRAILDGEEQGFARLHVRKGTDQLLGATIVAAHAGEMISELTVLMKAGKGVKTLTGTIHPYPTQAEVVKKAATLWRKARFTPRLKAMLSKWFEWTRRR